MNRLVEEYSRDKEKALSVASDDSENAGVLRSSVPVALQWILEDFKFYCQNPTATSADKEKARAAGAAFRKSAQADFQATDAEASPAIAAVRVLTDVIRKTRAETMMHLQDDLQTASAILEELSESLSVASACELFARFVTRTALDVPVFAECKQTLIQRSDHFTSSSVTSLNAISRHLVPFVRDGATVLCHSYSRVVLTALLDAAAQGARFRVLQTESRPDLLGYKMASKLSQRGIPVTVVSDCAVAQCMAQCSMVLVGAEAIVENGGILNKIGTYQLSIVAKAMGKPFYVAAETFKFTRLYPLDQTDFPQKFFAPRTQLDSTSRVYDMLGRSAAAHTRAHSADFTASSDSGGGAREPATKDMLFSEGSLITLRTPVADFTPPAYITLLFTELGVFTPSAVSDELIQMYS